MPPSPLVSPAGGRAGFGETVTPLPMREGGSSGTAAVAQAPSPAPLQQQQQQQQQQEQGPGRFGKGMLKLHGESSGVFTKRGAAAVAGEAERHVRFDAGTKARQSFSHTRASL